MEWLSVTSRNQKAYSHGAAEDEEGALKYLRVARIVEEEEGRGQACHKTEEKELQMESVGGQQCEE